LEALRGNPQMLGPLTRDGDPESVHIEETDAGGALTQALDMHDGAMKRIFSGTGNALSLLDRMKQHRLQMKDIPSVVTGDARLLAEEDGEPFMEADGGEPIVVRQRPGSAVPSLDDP
jgi:hypothetical protein